MSVTPNVIELTKIDCGQMLTILKPPVGTVAPRPRGRSWRKLQSTPHRLAARSPLRSPFECESRSASQFGLPCESVYGRVRVGVLLGVAARVGVRDAVLVGVRDAVLVGVRDAVLVGLRVGVRVADRVGVCDAVLVGVREAVLVGSSRRSPSRRLGWRARCGLGGSPRCGAGRVCVAVRVALAVGVRVTLESG